VGRAENGGEGGGGEVASWSAGEFLSLDIFSPGQVITVKSSFGPSLAREMGNERERDGNFSHDSSIVYDQKKILNALESREKGHWIEY
jgi:hypothetical protein